MCTITKSLGETHHPPNFKLLPLPLDIIPQSVYTCSDNRTDCGGLLTCPGERLLRCTCRSAGVPHHPAIVETQHFASQINNMTLRTRTPKTAQVGHVFPLAIPFIQLDSIKMADAQTLGKIGSKPKLDSSSFFNLSILPPIITINRPSILIQSSWPAAGPCAGRAAKFQRKCQRKCQRRSTQVRSM
jgi:hypothetical protein